MNGYGIQLSPAEFAGLDPQPLREIRRTLDPQPELSDGVWYWRGTFFDWEAFNVGNSTMRCPFAEPGRLLRVLEEWWADDENGCYYKAGDFPGTWWERVDLRCMETPGGMELAVDGEWNPPETMPPWASRYVLKIISVGIELHDGEWSWVIEVRSEG
ncbi:hypothetical protein LCGC14_0258210 [marine sediment metagenome]|uniref:Uncharacterized protein n=1 Tax=marine sediment metagenome TaxID=412755 RepID=A0A0F9UJ50_9ZZZZ